VSYGSGNVVYVKVASNMLALLQTNYGSFTATTVSRVQEKRPVHSVYVEVLGTRVQRQACRITPCPTDEVEWHSQKTQ